MDEMLCKRGSVLHVQDAGCYSLPACNRYIQGKNFGMRKSTGVVHRKDGHQNFRHSWEHP